MTIEEMKKHEWVVSWSGGKDSTATIILMHEHNIPIKKIIYIRMMYDENIPATLPIMTDFINDAIKVFEGWGYDVNIIKPTKTAKQMSERIYHRSKFIDRNEHYYGITAFTRGMCTFTDLKQKTIEKNRYDNDYQMIGYACDETDRLHRLTDTTQSIMVELEIKEKEAFEICKKYNLLSPLYELEISRDGCWFCPNAKKKERQLIKENYPKLYSKINEMIEMCDYDITGLIKSGRNAWVKDYFEERK